MILIRSKLIENGESYINKVETLEDLMGTEVATGGGGGGAGGGGGGGGEGGGGGGGGGGEASMNDAGSIFQPA